MGLVNIKVRMREEKADVVDGFSFQGIPKRCAAGRIGAVIVNLLPGSRGLVVVST